VGLEITPMPDFKFIRWDDLLELAVFVVDLNLIHIVPFIVPTVGIGNGPASCPR